MPKPRKIDDNLIAEAFEQNPMGNDNEIAEIVGCSLSPVKRYRLRHGIESSYRRRKPESPKPSVVERDPAEDLPRLIHQDPTRNNRQLAKLTGLTEDEVAEWRRNHRKEICREFGDICYSDDWEDVEECESAVKRCLANTAIPERKAYTRKEKVQEMETNEMIAALQDDKDTLTGELDKLIEERDRLLKENEMLKAQLSMMDGELNAERQLRAEYAERVTQPRELTEVERLKIFVADMVLQKGLPA